MCCNEKINTIISGVLFHSTIFFLVYTSFFSASMQQINLTISATDCIIIIVVNLIKYRFCRVY